MSEVIIVEEELMLCAANTEKYSEAAENMIDELSTVLQYISQNLLVSGDVATNFVFLAERVSALKNGFSEIMIEEKRVIEELVIQIDIEDNYLY